MLPLENFLPTAEATGLIWAAEGKHSTAEEEEAAEAAGGAVEVGDMGGPEQIPMDPCFLTGEMRGCDQKFSQALSSLDGPGAWKHQLTSSPVR